MQRDILGRTFATFFRSFHRVLIGVFLYLLTVLTLVTAFFMIGFGGPAGVEKNLPALNTPQALVQMGNNMTFHWQFWVSMFVMMILLTALEIMLANFMILLARSADQGGPFSYGAMLRRAFAKALPGLGNIILFTLALLIIWQATAALRNAVSDPMIRTLLVLGAVTWTVYLIVRWIMSLPVTVLEEGSLRQIYERSWALSEGVFWQLLGYLGTLGSLLFGAALIVSVIIVYYGGPENSKGSALEGVFNVLMMVMLQMMMFLSYQLYKWRNRELQYAGAIQEKCWSAPGDQAVEAERRDEE